MIGPVRIERRELFEQLAAYLERLILDGSLRPDHQLPPERDLQARFSVGRRSARR